MKADFSRLTFSGTDDRHYRRVLRQQGRVEVEADGNEQIAIDAHLAEVTNTDVIGAAGYPVGTGADGRPLGGFALALTADAKDVTISAGRFYADGVLVENDAAGATLSRQPHLPGASTPADAGAGAAGIYVAYLEVFERIVTALDDPLIRESALGGPDTSVRSQVVWQVKLARTGDVPADPANLPNCADIDLAALLPAPTGTLTAGTGAAADPMPCMLPPDSGYQRLENQLYRVEVHAGGGADDTATFKWSRENGSVVAMIVAPGGSGSAPTTASGPTFTVSGLKDDPTLGLKAGDWVELSDDATELSGSPGAFYQVTTTPTDGRTVTISDAPTVTLALHPKLRRWDQTGTGATKQGVQLTTATPLQLEGGVQVQFSPGTYRTGDYWLIPARTATSIAQGHIEWPADALGTPLALPPAGVARHYAKLGLLQYAADKTFSGLGSSAQPTDCRLPFWPLTDLAPSQSDCSCTIVARPGPGWEIPIQKYFTASGGDDGPHDAEICFPVGDYPISGTLRISGAGHVRIHGAGWGTRLYTTGDSETVLEFDDCASVAVRDVYASTAYVVPAAQATNDVSRISGTLSFYNCGTVLVEDAWVRCGGSPSRRGAACVTIASDVTEPNQTTGAGTATVRGCRLHPGDMQVGLQLIHLADAIVEDNDIAVDPTAAVIPLPDRLKDPGFLAVARSHLYSHLDVASAPHAPAGAAAAPSAPPTPAAPTPSAPATSAAKAADPNAQTVVTNVMPAEPAPAPSSADSKGADKAAAATPAGRAHAADILAAPPAVLSSVPINLQVGDQTFAATTDRALASTLQAYVKANAPATFATPTDARNYLRKAADKVLTDAAARSGYSAFSSVLRALSDHVPLAGRGISYGGQGLGRLVVSGNRIDGVIMGVSVGVSHRGSADETRNKQRFPDHMKQVRVVGNTITCRANDVSVKQSRFGIFVGSADSIEIGANTLRVIGASYIRSVPQADGIRVVGYLGPMMIIRGNSTDGFSTGIRVMPLIGNGPGRPAPAWEGGNLRAGLRFGPLWLVADNAIVGGSSTAPFGPFEPTVNQSAGPNPTTYIDAWQCLLADNVVMD